MMSVEWVALWDANGRVDADGFRDAAGLLGYRDEYDFHSASDVRSILYLAGSRRAVVDLLRWVRADARSCGRRAIGSFDADNTALANVLRVIGDVQTRIVMEDGTCRA